MAVCKQILNMGQFDLQPRGVVQIRRNRNRAQNAQICLQKERKGTMSPKKRKEKNDKAFFLLLLQRRREDDVRRLKAIQLQKRYKEFL